MDIVTLPEREFILGDKKTIGVRRVRSLNNVSLNGTTGTVSLYDSSGSAVFSGSSLTIAYNTDKTSVQGSYTLVTGVGGSVTTAGTYRAVYKLTFPDGTIYQWEQQIVVKANPF